MRNVQVDNVGTKLNIGGGNSSQTGGMTFIDPRMTMNGSIFPTNPDSSNAYKINPFNANSPKKAPSKPETDANNDIANGKETVASTQASANSTQDLTNNAKESAASAVQSTQTNDTTGRTLQSQGNKAVVDIKRNGQTAQRLAKEIEDGNNEVDSLNEQLAALSDGDNTGVGSSSAFSLDLPGSKQPAAQTTDNTNQSTNPFGGPTAQQKTGTEEKTGATGDENEQKKADITSQIETTSASVAQSSQQLQNTNQSTTTTLSMIKNLTASAAQKAAKTTQAAVVGQQGADKTLQAAALTSAAGATSVAGAQGLNALGISLLPNPVTTAEGTASITVAQAMNTGGQVAMGVGAAGSMAGQISRKDWTGASQSALGLSTIANNIKGKVSEAAGKTENTGKTSPDTVEPKKNMA